MHDSELRPLLDFAVEIAREAGAFTLEHFQAATPVELKSDKSPVTVADRGAEERLRRRIEAAYPEHGILGEEFGERPGRSPGRWILDPIDGTQSFISGVPLYSVLVGFEWAGEVLAGVIHLPALRETVYAARGLGCWWESGGSEPAADRRDGRAGRGPLQPRRAHVSEVRELAAARLTVTSAKLIHAQGRGAAYERLRAACLTDRGWSDAYGYALLATGRVEVVLDPLMSLWDTAALVPCIREAGGTLTDWSGRPTHTAPDVLATNGHVLEQALQALRND